MYLKTFFTHKNNLILSPSHVHTCTLHTCTPHTTPLHMYVCVAHPFNINGHPSLGFPLPTALTYIAPITLCPAPIVGVASRDQRVRVSGCRYHVARQQVRSDQCGTSDRHRRRRKTGKGDYVIVPTVDFATCFLITIIYFPYLLTC